MEDSRRTARTVARIVSEVLTRAAREAPRFEPGARVWIKIPAPERLRPQGMCSTVWREGIVLTWMDGPGAYQVTLSADPGLAFLASPERVRSDPPWLFQPAANDARW